MRGSLHFAPDDKLSAAPVEMTVDRDNGALFYHLSRGYGDDGTYTETYAVWLRPRPSAMRPLR
jgi:hypothetical protein